MSRRKAEDAIAKGWVKVNGQIVTEMGIKIDPDGDDVSFTDDFKDYQQSRIILAYYKPRGIVSNLPQGREKEIKDLLPERYRHLSTIGRLDKESEGLILLTDDGVFAKRCLDSEHPHEREYVVWVNKELDPFAVRDFEEGMMLSDGLCRPVYVTPISPLCYRMVLTEGKNRQIRRMVQKAGSAVTRLKRVRFGNYRLGKLSSDSYCEVTVDQVFSA